jgi:hypothetical protein
LSCGAHKIYILPSHAEDIHILTYGRQNSEEAIECAICPHYPDIHVTLVEEAMLNFTAQIIVGASLVKLATRCLMACSVCFCTINMDWALDNNNG